MSDDEQASGAGERQSSRADLAGLQKAYNDSYLACSTAAYYEGQGDEDGAMRSWCSALQQIHANGAADYLPDRAAQSGTEKALVDSLQQLELECQERIDILEAMRLSRQESGVSPSSSSAPAAEPDPFSPPALPPRPAQTRTLASRSSQAIATSPAWLEGMWPGGELDGSADGSSSTATLAVARPQRPPGADKHTLRTTLRTGRRGGEKLSKTLRRPASGSLPPEGPGASKAAAVAWSALGFGSKTARRQDERPVAESPVAESLSAAPHRSDEGQSRSREFPLPHWDSHTRRLVSPRDQGIGVQGPSSSGTDLTGTTRHSGEYPFPRPSSLSLNAAASALSLSSPSNQPQPRIAPRRRTDERVPRSRAPAASTLGNTGRGEVAMELSAPSDRSPSAEKVGTRRRERTRWAGGNSSIGPNDQRTDSPRANTRARRSERQPERRPSADSLGEPSGESENENPAMATAWGKRKAAIARSLPPGVDKAAALQILNDIVVHGDEVHWSDVAGLEVAKAALREAVVYPFLRPDLFMGLREPTRGMLLFGPPGTGKTMLARAVATESKSTFFSISASSLTSKYLGESEKLVRALFALARQLAPSIIFVDEIDSLLSHRSGSGEHEATRRIKTEFLIQWSDLQRAAAGRDPTPAEKGGVPEDPSRVLVLAATNLPWAIDEAARRRFVRRQYIPLPEAATREVQLKTLLAQQKHSLADADILELVGMTDGFSGSDITALAKDAAMGPLRSLGEALLQMNMDDIRPIGLEDFIASLQTIRPSVSKAGLEEYDAWAKQYGERGG